MENNSLPASGCGFGHSCQWLRSAQTLEINSLAGCGSAILISGFEMLKHRKATHNLDACSALLVSGFEMLKHWRATHSLDACSALLVSGSELLKHWGATHKLNACTGDLISGSELLKHWRATYKLNACTGDLIRVVLNCSNTEEQLTAWMGVQGISSVVLNCSNTGKQLTIWMHVQPFLSVVLNSNTRVTHNLDIFSNYLVSKIHAHPPTILPVCPLKRHFSGFNNLLKKYHIHTASIA
jgi:hypothetical protein